MSLDLVRTTLPHLLSHRGEEMGPIVPLQLIGAEQPEVGFVDQGRRLQRVTAAFAAKIVRRATPEGHW